MAPLSQQARSGVPGFIAEGACGPARQEHEIADEQITSLRSSPYTQSGKQRRQVAGIRPLDLREGSDIQVQVYYDRTFALALIMKRLATPSTWTLFII
jgi:hypothetical protein